MKPADWDRIHDLATLFDASDRGQDIVEETALILQVLKISEEAGEAAQAVIGTQGTNPRKGHSHTWYHVHAEVADVAITALVYLARALPDPAGYLSRQIGAKAAKFLHTKETPA